MEYPLEDYVIGSSNHIAFEQMIKVILDLEKEGRVDSPNTFLIHGKPGNGKTHFAKALVERAKASGCFVGYLTLEDFFEASEPPGLTGLRKEATDMERYTGFQFLVIDHLDIICADCGSEMQCLLSRIIDLYAEKGFCILFTALEHPDNRYIKWRFEENLLQRLKSAKCYELEAPDFHMKVDALNRFARRFSHESHHSYVEPEVWEWLAGLDWSMRQSISFQVRLMAQAHYQGETIDLTSAQRNLEERDRKMAEQDERNRLKYLARQERNKAGSSEFETED